MHAPPAFRYETARRILVPVGGRGRHHEMRARLLGTLSRTGEREVTFLKIVAPDMSEEALRDAERELAWFAAEELPGSPVSKVVPSSDVAGTVVAQAKESDLVILGLQDVGGERRFGQLALRIVRDANRAVVLVGGELDPAWHPQQVLDGLRRLPEAVVRRGGPDPAEPESA